MFDYVPGLSDDIDDQLDSLANIFSIIKTLNYIEKLFTSSQLDKHEFIKQSNKLLEQYNILAEAQPNFNLDNFCAECCINDCPLGINRIKKGAYQDSDTVGYANIMNLSSKFNDLANFISVNNGNDSQVTSKDLLSFLRGVISELQILKNIIVINCDEVKRLIDWSKILNSNPTKVLTINELSSIENDVNACYDYILSNLKIK